MAYSINTVPFILSKVKPRSFMRSIILVLTNFEAYVIFICYSTLAKQLFWSAYILALPTTNV